MDKKSKIKLLGIITARGGSKGIPKKNIKSFCGKPLIFYTISCAKESGVFDRIIVSTDDDKIAKIARQYGVEVPFIRPKSLAKDNTPTLSVIQHAVKWLIKNESYLPDYVSVLQPTSPLRQPFHVKEAFDLILKSKADSVLGVCEIPASFSPFKAMHIKNGYLKLLDDSLIYKRTSRRQDLEKTYYSNGAIYILKAKLLLDEKNASLYGEKTVPYIMDVEYSIDIDTETDFEMAECFYNILFSTDSEE